jgi:hypothetical protein
MGLAFYIEFGENMFKIDQILKRAWQILWNYKILWIFAFLLALAGGSSNGAGGGGNSGSSYRYSGNHNQTGSFSTSDFENLPWVHQVTAWFTQNFHQFFDTPQHIFVTVLWLVLILVGISLVCTLILALVRYPTETAIMRMVDEYDSTGVKKTFKQGWKMGWNRRAFNVWLVDLIIGIPMFVIVMGFLAIIGLSVYNMVALGNANTSAMTGWIGILVVAALCFIPIALVFALVNIIRQYIVRFVAIEGESVGHSFSKGWKLFTHNAKNTLLIWLVLIGVGIAAGIALMVAALLLIPAYALMAIPGAVAAAVPGAIGYGITSLFAPYIWPWVIGALLAIPFFFAITFSPLTFLSGCVSLYSSNVWTLTYRQLKVMAVVPPAMPLPLPVPPVPDEPAQ